MNVASVCIGALIAYSIGGVNGVMWALLIMVLSRVD